MRLSSTAFANEGEIPTRYTCDGLNVSPPLTIRDVPRSAATLVLTMDDIDVPRHINASGTWDHWVVYNIPPHVNEIREGEEPPGDHGQGTAGNRSYHGPCPLDGEHRYYFNLYALDVRLELHGNPTKAELIQAMVGHVLERTGYMGRYRRR